MLMNAFEGLAVESKQTAILAQLDITLSALRDAMLAGLETGSLDAAKDVTVTPVLKRFDAVLTAKATYTTSGDHTLVDPPPGQAVRAVWLYAQAKGALDTGVVVVSFTLGSKSYEFELTGSQPFAHSAVWDGAADANLVVNTSSTAAVMINVDYRLFTP